MSTLSRARLSDFTGTQGEWNALRATASMAVKTDRDEVIFGDSPEIYENATEVDASEKAPYGDVHYCDDGMRSDGKKRFPVDTPERIRAAWSYSHHKSIMDKYTSSQLSRLHACIEKAWKAKISKDGPPSAE